MKIVNRKEFLNLPKETLFSTYSPIIFTGIDIKTSTPGDMSNDYFYSQIIGAVDCNDCGEFVDRCMEMEKGISCKMDFDTWSRDGGFQDDEMYAVYEKQDVEALIERLKKCL